MSGNFSSLQSTFRKVFRYPKAVVQWFPGHMQKGFAQIQSTLKQTDCIIEIHDARIPFSGRNLYFRELIQLRPHILLLNKVDLIEDDSFLRACLEEKLKKQGVDTVFFTNLCKNEEKIYLKNNIVPKVIELTESRPRYNREGTNDYNVLVVGIPNVGKSTFINTLRAVHLQKKNKATAVGANAGVTRSVLSKIRVCFTPPVYVIDSPGILSPHIRGLDTGMRLAVCSCVPDHVVGEVNIADYILFWLNSHGHFSYVDYFGLEEPIDSVLYLLSKIALLNRKVHRVKNIASNQYVYRPDNITAAQMFISAFREGHLGKFILDKVS